MKVLVLGGVAAGTKIAAKLMREDRANEVTVLNKGRNISYAGCGCHIMWAMLLKTRKNSL